MIKKNDHAIFAAGYFQPPQIRADFYTIYWLNKELTRIVYSTRERALGMGKIDFWQDSIESIYEGKANKEPISVALLQAVKNSGLPKPILLRII